MLSIVFLPFCFIADKCNIGMAGFTHDDGDDGDKVCHLIHTDIYCCVIAVSKSFVDCTYGNPDIDRSLPKFN